MNINEKEKLNEAINELSEAMDEYESLNDQWIRDCLDNKEYYLLVGVLMPLASMQRVNEKLQQLWVKCGK
jgi:hypothetical protein